jgi:hypothetical protein
MKEGYGSLNKWVRASLALLLVLLMLMAAFEPVIANDDGPLVPGYTLQDGQRVPAPTGYIQAGYFTGEGQDFGPFLAPQDLFRDPETGNLLVADTGNNRVVVLDKNGELLLIIGEEANLKGPEGVFVDQLGNIWVADKGNQRVAVFRPDGTLLDEHVKPESTYLDNVDFKPSKVVVDKRGFMYVVTGSENTLGVLVIDSTERFRGFFGRTRIRFDLGRTIARALATKEQRRRMLSISPAPLINLHLDSQGFIYAVSPVMIKDQIQRLNSVGTNVYGEVGVRTGAGRLWDKLRGTEGIVFGEQEVRWGWNDRMRMSVPRTHGAQFIAITVDELGIVSVIDSRNNQVYQYDQAGNLLAIFGGQGASKGFFIQPVSIAAGDLGLLYILDSGRGNIQIFRPTELTRMIHQASYEYFNGDYDRAASLWGEIAQRNTNFSLAHSGLGKSLMSQKRYEEAMQEYYFAENKHGYSAAFSEYRYLWMRSRFSLLGLAILGTVAVVSFTGSRAVGGLRRLIERVQQMQLEAGLWAVPVLLVLTILSWMISLSVLSFHFQTRRPEEIRLLFESGKIIIPWITWCIAAFGVGEIFFGEGTFRRILIQSAWALWPVIVFAIPVNLITNVLSLNEASIYNTLWYVIWTLLALQFLNVIKDAHNFDFGQAVGVSLLTLVGIVAVWILLGLIYALTAEIFRFIGQLIMEVYVRLY